MPRVLSVAVVVALLIACGGGGDGNSAPTPAISRITPRGGPPAGGTAVVITGSGFAPGATATFGGGSVFGAAAATNVVWVSSGEIHLQTPAHAAGSVDVTVHNPDGGTATLPGGFMYALPPEAVAPLALRAPVGTAVPIDGRSSTALPSSWQWSLASAPTGSTATVTDATAPVAHLTLDVPGAYVIQLVVSDAAGPSNAASTTVETIATRSKVPDSGQLACYDDVGRITCQAAGASRFGQDGQYAIHPVVFSAEAATVTDPVTGLVWQRVADPAKHNWYEATGTVDPVYNPAPGVNVCGDLIVAGHADWRLPTRRELFTLLRFEYVIGQPLADVDAFPDTQAGNYWTSTPPPPGISVPWSVDFSFGRATYGFGPGNGLSVRCVRGASWGGSAFADPGDGTVRDDGTGLVWEREAAVVARTWAGALAYCEALALAGGGWRLPSAKEMDAFIDGSGFAMPAVDQALFPNTQSAKYWTSTTDPLLPTIAYVGDMAFGWLDSGEYKTTSNFVRCVR